MVDLRPFAFAQDKFWICDGSTSLTTGFGFWIDGAKHMNETFQSRFLDSQSDNRKLDVLGEGESIFEGALVGEEHRCQTSQPFDQTSFIDGFDLFGHYLGRKRETKNPLGYDCVTGREMRRVLGKWDDDHELAVLIDTIIGENDHGPSLFDLDADGRVEISDYDITPLYVDHWFPPPPRSPKPPGRSISTRSTARVPLSLRGPGAGYSTPCNRAPFVCVRLNQERLSACS
jgi:hypothetical protein